jgi:hypothetical protein
VFPVRYEQKKFRLYPKKITNRMDQGIEEDLWRRYCWTGEGRMSGDGDDHCDTRSSRHLPGPSTCLRTSSLRYDGHESWAYTKRISYLLFLRERERTYDILSGTSFFS